MYLMEVEASPVQYLVPPPTPPPAAAKMSTTTTTTTLAPLLPPCRVCGEKASGFHYGANTCEACKGFFRRSLQRKEEYKCLSSGSCKIGVGRRNACAYCRWQKCLAVGMSKTAIKTGRYTHEKKTKDIEEVKRLQLQQNTKAEVNSTGGEESQSSYSSSNTTTSPHSSLTLLDSPPSSPKSEEELEKIIQHITAIHLQQTPHTPEFFDKLAEKEKEFLEQRELQQKMFGRMKPIPREEYMQIYQSTGIDIDGRREMIKHMLPCVEKSIKRFITFAKALPGFKDLPITDQISLIKAYKCPSMLVLSNQRFNVEEQLFFTYSGRVMHMDDFERTESQDKWEGFFRFVGMLNKLNLSMEETCLLTAVNMFLADGCEMTGHEQLQESLSLCLACLQLLLRRNHPDDRFIFPKIIAILTELRSVSDMCEELGPLKRVKDMQMLQIDLPPLFYELWSTD